MELLILGGTRFSGWFTSSGALARGHRVTLVHRGESLEPGGLAGAEHIVGDRTDPDVLAALHGRDFDAVIDFCAYFPGTVRETLGALGEIGHYTLISSESAYDDTAHPNVDEGGTLHEPASDHVDEITEDTYGPLKVACERVVQEALGDRLHLVRPGLIIGPRDPSDRFTWWPVRIAAGGRTLAPAPPEALMQGIDARDLAAFLLHGAETGLVAVHNADGHPTPLGELLDLCAAEVESPAEVTWVDPEWLEAQEVQPWTEVPLWVGTDEENAGFNAFDARRAREAGLMNRPLAQTVRDTLAWASEVGRARGDLQAGLSEARESELLAAWAARDCG